MNSDRLEQLFLKAIELPDPAAQRHFVEAETAGDLAAREKLLKLLEYHAESDSSGFLEVPLLQQDPSLASLSKTTDGVAEDLLVLERLLGPVSTAAPMGQLGRFALLEIVGKGGSAIVYRARDTKLAREVAVKLLLPSLSKNEQARARFVNEARAIAAIRHPNVVAIYEVGEQQGVPFIVMEYLPAGSLQARIAAHGPLTAAECMTVSSQLAAALEVAHATGLHHRDVKPSNVLIDIWPTSIKLGDFGLASPKTGAAISSRGGTPQFAAPEQLRAEPVDERTDLFGLGCTMYAMLSGRSPFSSGSRLQMINLTLNSQPADLMAQRKDLPPRMEPLIRRLLEKNPDRRPASAREVFDELDAIKTGPAGLSRRGLIGSGAVALLALAGFGWYQSKQDAGRQRSLLPGRRYYYYLSDKNLGSHLHQAENAVCVFGEGKPGPAAKPLSYWRVANPGTWGSVTYRFPFAEPLQVCRLFAQCYCTFGLDPAAKMRLQISADGTNWTLVTTLSRAKSEQYFLSDQSVTEIQPKHERETVVTQEVVFINAGGTPRNHTANNGILNWPNGARSQQLFVRAELYAEQELFAEDGSSLGPAAAQFLRYRPEYQNGPLFIDYDAVRG
jgi:tRNA A-37 threonylcarbamoyl transferase component Bud32